ncbi:MAG: DUF1553 domain-containing protein [Brevundimonas sp.]
MLVNRLWAHHFGAGIVSSPDDFGNMSEAPSHPELLDWMATTLVGWLTSPGMSSEPGILKSIQPGATA